MIDQDIMRQLLESFRQELAERLASINAGLLALEQQPQAGQRNKLLEELFRHVHSLKGAARAVELKSVEKLAHGMEDVFGAAKRGTIQLTAPLFDLLYHGLDLIGAVMAGVESGQGTNPDIDLPDYLVRLAQAWRGQPVQPPEIEAKTPRQAAQPPALAPAEPIIVPWNGETIRVPTTRLDELMAQAGELLVARLRSAQQVEEIKDLHAFVLRWHQEWQRARDGFDVLFQRSGSGGSPQARTVLEQTDEKLRSLAAWLGQLSRRLADDANRLSLVTDELQDGVKKTRMLPLATLVGAFRRMVRDLAREKGVEIVLDVHGAGTGMDKHVLEQIQDPLMHLLRNCIDHGIEPPEERKSLDKPYQGTITLRAEREGNAIVVAVADDGRGIDTSAVRQAAVRREILSKEAAAEMSDDQATALVFAPGLSTAKIITEVSGRGIGLDVVRRNTEALQGRAEVYSVPGKGTTFTLTLPLTLVSTRCLLVRVAGRPYALPLPAVERMVPVGRDEISMIEGKEAICWQGQPLSLIHMAEVLGLSNDVQPLNGKRLPAVILAAEGRRIAFLVDELLDEAEIVVKSLGKQLARIPNVAGAAVLGTGGLVLVLNATDLLKSAQSTSGQRTLPTVENQATQTKPRTILVVDDSITTRTLEKNILSTAGYEVKLAIDGQEALVLLMDNPCDLVVSDIDMPRLDGFELTQRIKQDERYGDLPVILVTSLESPEDRARGIEVGADAYIVKSTFDQDNLLETIRQLV